MSNYVVTISTLDGRERYFEVKSTKTSVEMLEEFSMQLKTSGVISVNGVIGFNVNNIISIEIGKI